jgi:predicted DNA-binding protein (UPF0251 family)
MSQLDVVELELSELEAMRLCDYEGLDQTAAGQHMGVSRGTVQRLLARGRLKLLGALLHEQAVQIQEGATHERLYSKS